MERPRRGMWLSCIKEILKAVSGDKMYRGNKFKNAVGAHLLKALFYEVSEDGTRVDCLYSLKQEDSPDIQDNSRIYPSIHRLYVEMGDATEYEFAKKYFKSSQDLRAMAWRKAENKLTEEDKKLLAEMQKEYDTIEWDY